MHECHRDVFLVSENVTDNKKVATGFLRQDRQGRGRKRGEAQYSSGLVLEEEEQESETS